MIYILEHWEAIAGIILFISGGGLVAWKLKRIEVKEATATAEQKDAEAVMAIKELYGSFVGDYKLQYKELQDQIRIIREELNAVKKENIEQRKDLRTLHKENKELRADINNWREKYNALKLEFDLYRAKDERLKKISAGGK
ncbi:hypothetical protein EI546_06645 [Aequorivita sp. H23M31]|uniref:Uncharacterized protein n=1 Tax=Aequorivita ciconiae TaxID=2494375 RepID=A0A410G2B3_9FLAO|nr:hypothetical protein [Aequorivita sp. H23M31]QAA81428.1 hypothetical protein EI546_06645 [Aequorivita sp. H23M31]